MLSNTTDDDHLAVLAIAGGFAPVSRADFAPLLLSLECRDLAAGEALPAAERLALLREAMPGLEQRVAHRLVASYLGVTPVTLSRLRRQSGSV